MIPDWLQDPAALATVALAVVWLAVHWLRIGKPRGSQAGCSRCESNPSATDLALGPSAVRSKQLRIID